MSYSRTNYVPIIAQEIQFPIQVKIFNNIKSTFSKLLTKTISIWYKNPNSRKPKTEKTKVALYLQATIIIPFLEPKKTENPDSVSMYDGVDTETRGNMIRVLLEWDKEREGGLENWGKRLLWLQRLCVISNYILFFPFEVSELTIEDIQRVNSRSSNRKLQIRVGIWPLSISYWPHLPSIFSRFLSLFLSISRVHCRYFVRCFNLKFESNQWTYIKVCICILENMWKENININW